MFMRELKSIRVDNNMEEPIQVIHHPLILQNSMQGPQGSGRADPLSCMDP